MKKNKVTQDSTSEVAEKALLEPLLTEKSERLTSYKKRNDHYYYESIHPADLQEYESDGWELHRESKTRIRMKRQKSHDRLLEDQTWCLFYRMGYPELNGEQFKITFERHDGSIGAKQIDVFAKDDETVLVVECKSREARGRRTLQKDLHETDSLQKSLATAIRKHYGDPPYTVKHNLNGFIKYNEKMFHWDDQVRLSKCLIRAKDRGCIVLLTNANHPSVVELYENDFELTPLKRNSVIAASSENRGVYEELIVTSYSVVSPGRSKVAASGVAA